MNEELDVSKIIAETLTNLVEKNISKIYGSIKGFFSDSLLKTEVEIGTAFKKYLRKACKKYSQIKTLLYRDAPKYIYDFYECNYLAQKSKLLSACDINNVLDISHFIVVSGTAGIGKSTMLKHFFINTINVTDLIPIFVELKSINNRRLTLFDCMYESMHNLGFSLEKDYFEYALKSGCFVLLLDGYDEISEKEELFQEIDALCDKYSDNYFIVTSRPSDDFISWQRFTILGSRPFTKEQAINLVRKIDYNKEIKQVFLDQLEDHLYDTHSSFASNPLLLNIMLLTFESYAEIPDKLHIFYANAFETLFTKHDATKGGYKRGLKCKLASDCFQNSLSEFCFKSYAHRKMIFNRTELEEILRSIKGLQDIDKNEYIEDLITSVCILYVEGLNYQFTHRSFQEYFTAVFLKNLDDELQGKTCMQLIKSKSNSISHDSVFSMLFDMNKERFEKNIIIPFLDEYIRDVESSDDKLRTIFNTDYTGVIVHEGEDENDKPGIGYTIKAGHSFTLRNFIFHKYGSYLNRKKENDHYYEMSIINHINVNYGVDNELDYDQIVSDKTLSDYFLSINGYFDFIYNESRILLNEIQKRQEETSLDIDSLFN